MEGGDGEPTGEPVCVWIGFEEVGDALSGSGVPAGDENIGKKAERS